MGLSREQVTRFYETLALLVANREGVDIKVMSVTPRGEGNNGEQNGTAYSSVQKREKVRVS